MRKMVASLVSRSRLLRNGGGAARRRSPPRFRVCERNRTSKPMPVLSTRVTSPACTTIRVDSSQPRLMHASRMVISSPVTIRPTHLITNTLPQWRESRDSDMRIPLPRVVFFSARSYFEHEESLRRTLYHPIQGRFDGLTIRGAQHGEFRSGRRRLRQRFGAGRLVGSCKLIRLRGRLLFFQLDR